MKELGIFRQGDVFMRRYPSDVTWKEIGVNIDKYNQIQGDNQLVIEAGREHTHSLQGDDVGKVIAYGKAGGSLKLLDVMRTVKMVHPEHDSMPLEPGKYVRLIQKTTDPVTKAKTQVLD